MVKRLRKIIEPGGRAGRVGLRISFSRCSSPKGTGATSNFSPVHFALRTGRVCRGRNAQSEIRVAPRFWRSLHHKPNAPRSFAQVEYCYVKSGEAGLVNLRLMKRCRKRGRSPCFERFVSECRRTEGWNGRRECDTVRNLWLHPEVFGKPRTRLAESVANCRAQTRRVASEVVGEDGGGE